MLSKCEKGKMETGIEYSVGTWFTFIFLLKKSELGIKKNRFRDSIKVTA